MVGEELKSLIHACIDRRHVVYGRKGKEVSEDERNEAWHDISSEYSY